MNRTTRVLMLILLISVSNSIKASKIEKAFEALAKFDYYGAKELFKKLQEKEPIASPYGQSLIFGRSDNPFYNIDSAYIYVSIAESAFKNADDAAIEELMSLDIDSSRIAEWKDSIDYKAFEIASLENTLESFQKFVDRHRDSRQMEKAVASRDKLAFQRARSINSARAYNEFIEKYPESEQITESKNRFEERLFIENTVSNEILEFVNFIKEYPNSPFVIAAEDSIYNHSIVQPNQESYLRFIKTYPKNHNVNEAWRNIYRLYTAEYSPQKIIEFRIDYPEYPFIDELMEDMKLASKVFLPFKDNGLYGFMSVDSEILIEAEFNAVESFIEGLALVVKNDKIGFLDKSGNVVVPFEYDDAESFVNGSAIVSKADKYGLINRNNKQLVALKYDLVGNFYSSLALVANDTAYGFVNKNGDELIPLSLQYASDFQNGYSLIEKDDLKGMINTLGVTVVDAKYSWLEHFNSEGIARAKNDSAYGLLDKNGAELCPFIYDRIGSFSRGMAIAVKKGKYGYINTNGEVVIEFKFDFIDQVMVWGDIKNGTVKFHKGEKYGIVNQKGEELFPAIFQDLGEYSETEWVAVKKRGKWGYSNKSLQLVAPYEYNYTFTFIDELGLIQNEEGYNFINKKLELQFSESFDKVEKLDSIYIATRGKLKGAFSTSLEPLIEIKYNKVEVFSKDYLKLTEGDTISYWNRKKRRLITSPNK